MPERPSDEPPVHRRRRRYAGRNPREFRDKYKELNPERYPEDVRKVLAAGKTPAGMHVPIMVAEVLGCLRPRAGEVAVDCTLGGGGHARAIVERVQPGGRLIGFDVDPFELPRTEARLRAAGFGPETFVARQANFAGLARALSAEGLGRVDLILADLGVSSMQYDNPDRGFSYKGAGPLDMRMNPRRGESAAQLVARSSEADLVQLLMHSPNDVVCTPVLDLMNVRYVVAYEPELDDRYVKVFTTPPGEFRQPRSVYERKDPLPRAFVVARGVTEPTEGMREALCRLDPRAGHALRADCELRPGYGGECRRCARATAWGSGDARDRTCR